jgi:hypothetical protein
MSVVEVSYLVIVVKIVAVATTVHDCPITEATKQTMSFFAIHMMPSFAFLGTSTREQTTLCLFRQSSA